MQSIYRDYAMQRDRHNDSMHEVPCYTNSLWNYRFIANTPSGPQMISSKFLQNRISAWTSQKGFQPTHYDPRKDHQSFCMASQLRDPKITNRSHPTLGTRLFCRPINAINIMVYLNIGSLINAWHDKTHDNTCTYIIQQHELSSSSSTCISNQTMHTTFIH